MKNRPLYIVWSHENNDIGVAILDEQRRGIVASINSLHYFIQQGLGLDALKPTLQIVGAYIGFHLKTEEMFLEECDYPEMDKYKESCKEILAEFADISKKATMYREPELLLRFLRDWLFTHIKDEHNKAYS